MSVARHHAEWLSLVEVSGPFLSMPVLLRVFPEGLDRREDTTDARIRVHAAHEEWLDNQGGLSPDPAIHRAWLRFMLREVLEIDGELLAEGQSLPPECAVALPEHGERLIPTLAVLDPPGRPTAGKARVLIDLLPRGQSLESPLAGGRWKASPATRMMTLLHGAGARIGLITNGEHWVLVHAAPGETATYASFYSSLFLEEPITLRAFQSLLGARRLFGVADEDTLEALFRESGQNQQEVTDQLGAQVRRAVEVLIQTIDKVDHDRGRELLRGVSETTLYEAAVTVMMRLVFLFAAEERDLLLLGDPLYDQHYAVSTLRDQLQAAADAHGSEVLQRRHDAWSRLLATFRAVHGGVRHEAMRLPPYGGSLFDPDRFPFLEGRAGGTRWREAPALPLAVDNLTVLDLLRSLQVLEVRVPGGGPAEARRLSFRALDVEQIGHVYEGLLDHTARRAKVPVLSLKGSKNQEPEVEITALEGLRAQGEDKLLAFLKDVTGRSEAALRKAAGAAIAKEDRPRWLLACGNDPALFERVLPFAGLVREDVHGRPVVFGEGAVYVTEGQERRATGTHYTPKSLTEPIVQYTLEPLVYEGPAEGWVKEKWRRKGARELLELRVCDMAMGSGAFLVQACRYLSERLVEAWADAEDGAGGKLVVTPEGALGTGDPSERPLPKNQDERLAIARRVVADRCLYGVDKNPMAVEMAKLSLWLVTLQKDRPFTFVDHALRWGDSLLGVTRREQLEKFHLKPDTATQVLLGENIFGTAFRSALDKRHLITSMPELTIEDTTRKEKLLAEADAALDAARVVADLVVGAALAHAGKRLSALDDEIRSLSVPLSAALDEKMHANEREQRLKLLETRGFELLGSQRSPFHWVIEFPEVFVTEQQAARGFHALIGNPPFMGGRKISGNLGDDYSALLRDLFPTFEGQADLVGAFVLRAAQLMRPEGAIGFIASNTISEGDTRASVLEELLRQGCTIFRAKTARPWPGTASVYVCDIHVSRIAQAARKFIDDRAVAYVSSFLDEFDSSLVRALRSNMNVWFKGTGLGGDYFDCTSDRSSLESEWIKGYCNGQELNALTVMAPPRWVVDFTTMHQPPVAPVGAAGEYLMRRAMRYYQVDAPERLPKNWFRFRRSAAALYEAIRGLRRVIVRAQTSSTWAFVFLPTDWLFDQKHVVFASESAALLGCLQSSVHRVWADRFGGTLRADQSYNPSDCFESFPLPKMGTEHWRIDLNSNGESLHMLREQLMKSRGLGLTALSHRIEDPEVTDPAMTEFREALCSMDISVVRAYGWADIKLNHGFYDGRQGKRFTVSESARRELLLRLFRLNSQRHAEEEAQGLHDGKTKRKKVRGAFPLAPKESAESTEQGAFNFGDAPLAQPTPAKRGRRPKKS